MQLRRMLGIQPGLTAIIGGGGKTTLLYALARELSQTARVIVCTTTHILPPEHLPCLTDGTETGNPPDTEKNEVRLRGNADARGKIHRAGSLRLRSFCRWRITFSRRRTARSTFL